MEKSITISRNSLSDQAADLLREQILIENLKPGQILAERDLAENLGISRTPLRDALRILATEGLIELIPNLRPRIANPSLDELLDRVDVLASLERLSGEIVAKKVDNATIKTLDKLLVKMKQKPKEGKELVFFKLDMAFHQTIVSATENEPLIQTHKQYNSAVFRARFMSSSWKARRPLMHNQHESVVEHFKTNNSKAAGEVLFSHLMQLKTNLIDLYKERPN